MPDTYRVNILNEGRIPYLNIDGPVFGYPVSAGVYPLLLRVPGIIMTVVTTKAEADSAYAEYYKSKNKINMLHEVPTDTIEEKVANGQTSNLLEEKKEETLVEDYLKEVGRKYTEAEIELLNKRQCKEILEARGYKSATEKFSKSDPLAWKYHDSVEVLRNKVRATQ